MSFFYNGQMHQEQALNNTFSKEYHGCHDIPPRPNS